MNGRLFFLAAFAALLFWGALQAGGPAAELIMSELRWPRALTALVAGACLGVSGLMLQSLFHNPLAGPDLLGVQSGAALGLGLWMALAPTSVTGGGALGLWSLGPWAFACLGAFGVTGALLLLSLRLRSPHALLLAGVVLSSFAGSALGLLVPLLEAQGLKSYMMWGLGSFERLSRPEIPLFVAACGAGLGLSLLMVRPLNSLLAGEEYARALWGPRTSRIWTLCIVGIASLCSALVTVGCGPIALVGLLAPHTARWCMGSGHHKLLLPASALMGSLLALGLQVLLSSLPWPSLTINALAGTFGLPAVLYLLVRKGGRA